LDYGHKYIPNYYFDSFNIFKTIFNDLDNEIINFNSQIFFKDQLIARNMDLIEKTIKISSFFDFLKKPWHVDGCKNIPIVTETLV
jgi:hypothetical protein